MGGADDGVRKPLAFARGERRYARGIAQFGFAATADEAFAQEGLIEHAEHRHALVLKPDQRAPERLAGDEGARAVDGIEHPAIAARARRVAQFFAENPVLRKTLSDHRAHDFFGAAVGFGDGIVEARRPLSVTSMRLRK